jgi:PAS domain S-box-containing protein
VKNEFTDESLSKKRLINELKELSRQIAELEKPESWRNHAEGVLHRASQELELVNDHDYGTMASRTQDERRKAQEKIAYQAHLLANVSDAIIATDERFNITYWNPAAEKVFGWKADEVLNRPDHEVLRSEFIGGRRREVAQTLVRTGCFRGEMIQYNRDGKPVYIETTAVALRDGDGRITGYVSVNRDITDRKRMEEALKENEEKYRLYFENISDVIYFLDTDFRLLSISPTVEKILGYKPEELIGKQVQDMNVLAPEYLQAAFSNGTRVISGESIPPSIYEFIARDGTRKLGEVSGAPLIRDGKVIGIISVARDITERRKMEIALKASEKKYSTLVEKGNDGIVIIQDHLLKFINPVMAEISGFSMNDVIGKPFIDFVSSPFRELVNDMYAKRLMGEEIPNKYEVELISKHGKMIPVEINASLIEYEGKPADMAIIRDITERKLTEKEIKKSLKEKEMLLSEIYHRVKNNMQIITSLLRLQSRHVREEEYREMFKESQNRIISMSLVHEKLYQSKDLTQIDFNDYIRDLIKGLFQSYGANKGNIALNIYVNTISLGIDFAIPCGLIINELVTNSLKHAFPDGRKGEIKIVLHSTDENMIELVVGDNGIGIPEDMDFKITKTLGLHLVTMLAENQLHGDINLNRNKGTEFIIKFKDVK